ncbi:MAG: substrate-binding domain-containing protein [Clostridia bacterium]|nr:substrate-binding domain-containing protein [Clostridia bacterium]
MKRSRIVVALLIAAAIAAGAYLVARGPRDGGTQKTWLIGMSQANLIEPWRVTMNLEFREAAQARDDLRVIYTDAAQDTERQVKDVEMLMGYGIDLLVISPNDSEVLRPVLSEVYKKIPVIVLDRAVSGEDYTLFIGPDNDQIGYLAGERVLEMLGDTGGTVVEVLGTEDSPPVAARQEAFRRALEGHPEIILEDALPANWLQDQAQDRFKEYLVVHGKTADVVVAQNDAMAYGAWLAAESLRVDGIRFIGVDGLEGDGGGAELVRQGILDATIYCPTGGSQAVDYSLRILSGEVLKEKQVILEPVRIVA